MVAGVAAVASYKPDISVLLSFTCLELYKGAPLIGESQLQLSGTSGTEAMMDYPV